MIASVVAVLVGLCSGGGQDSDAPPPVAPDSASLSQVRMKLEASLSRIKNAQIKYTVTFEPRNDEIYQKLKDGMLASRGVEAGSEEGEEFLRKLRSSMTSVLVSDCELFDA